MNIDAQLKIESDQFLKRYLQENSIWYKYLNRDSKNLDLMIKEAKEKYKVTPGHRFTQMINNIDMVMKFLDIIK